MEPALVISIIAAVPAIIGGGLGGIAALKQRSNDSLHLTIGAMQDHMRLLEMENEAVRLRLTVCEKDRELLWKEIRGIKNGG